MTLWQFGGIAVRYLSCEEFGTHSRPVMSYTGARILEIGDHSYFRQSHPDTTTLLWTGHRPASHLKAADYQDCTPRRLMQAMRAVRHGLYDLVVVYPHARSAWHPRCWLRALAHTPLQPLSAFSRGFGVGALRYFTFETPLVVVDMHDDFTIHRSNFFLLDRAKLYFKRELPVDAWVSVHGTAHHDLPTARLRSNRKWQSRLTKLHPISLQIGRIDLDGAEAIFAAKSMDVFFAGNVETNSTLRRDGIEQLQKLAKKGFRIDIATDRLSHEEYLRRMSSAWLAWSPSGRGWDCYRHYEAPQCLTVPVINYPTIRRHRPLEDGRHAIYYAPEGNGLADAIERTLHDRERLKQIALAGREHVQTHHVDQAFCNGILAASLATN
jgi:hypothetical protein